MSPAPDERDRIRAAIDPILQGTPQHSNGALTVVALAQEAGVPSNASLHGLGERTDFTDKAEQEEAADHYLEEHFASLLSAPFQAPAANWAELIEATTAAHDTHVSAQEAAEAWITTHQPAIDEANVRGTLAEYAQLLQAGVWAARITTSFFEVAQRLHAISSSPIGDGEDFWSRQPPRDLMPFVPEQAAGNLMALQWQPNPGGDSGSFSILWLRGVGRWLLYHLHDLLTADGQPHARHTR
ncbi:hypothetical protein [Streptomyces sp. NPDC001401]|uniref:hypothetical protein n=1 Tax=Streptomyces sp. NPDC001401 TaxID=3364570 RepID=UPI0036C2BC87